MEKAEALDLSAAAPSTKTWMLWTGRVLTALPSLVLLFSASMKLSHAPDMVKMWTEKFGYTESALTPIGILEILVVAVCLVPRTAVLGAILATGYLGGAIATHVRVGDPFLVPLVVGMMAWGGVFFRDARLRTLIPLRKPSAR